MQNFNRALERTADKRFLLFDMYYGNFRGGVSSAIFAVNLELVCTDWMDSNGICSCCAVCVSRLRHRFHHHDVPEPE